MCGITGIYNFKNEALNSRSLRAMTNKIRHRGPDDEGYFLTDIRENINNFAFGDDTNEDLKTSLIDIKKCKSANLGFGFRRLSIQDLSSKGHQPMIDNESNAVIVFNGEIYNFIELRNELKEKGYHFNSLTDTEIILNAYLEWGEECVNHFNGMWAFAIWDIKEKKLFCSRDRFGIKPFYYYISSNKFSFASEIKALLEIVPASKNNNALSRYLYFDEIDTTHETFFENIYQLRPGYSLIIQNGRFENKPYYNILDHIKRIGNGKKITFFKKFQNAVKLRLRSDVELGFALSGGIDSSSIVCMSNLIDGSTKKTTFSIVYPGETIDESQFIDEVIQKTKFEKASITPEFKDFKSDLSDFIYFQEEPVPDLSYYNEYRLRKFIKEKKVIVTLEGQGADEVITGYRSFVLPFYFDLISSFRFKKLRNEMKAFSHFYKIKMSELIIRFLLSKIPKSIFLKIKRFYKKKSNGLINQNYFKINNKPTEKKYGNRQLNSALLNSLLINSIPKQLNRADKSAMAFSLECRFPFLDNKLVEYCFGLDDNKKMINGITKHILRSSMKKYLPKKIFKRKDKIGFISPQSKWLRSLSDFFDDIVYSESFKERPYINWKKFEKKYTEFRDNKNDDSKELWKIFGVFLWEQNFFKIDR